MAIFTRKFKKDFTYRGLGGKSIIIERELSKMEIENNAFNDGNWACYNFIDRREDFNCIIGKKLYYGHAEDGLGYVICEDELEEIQ